MELVKDLEICFLAQIIITMSSKLFKMANIFILSTCHNFIKIKIKWEEWMRKHFPTALGS